MLRREVWRGQTLLLVLVIGAGKKGFELTLRKSHTNSGISVS